MICRICFLYILSDLYHFTSANLRKKDKKCKESIKILRKCDISDILISHDSPYQLYSKANDKAHCGMKGITKYLKKNKIYLNIHGHHHINTKLVLSNGTNVIGVYRCAMIQFPTLEKKLIF